MKIKTRKLRIKLLRLVFFLAILTVLFTGHSWMGNAKVDFAITSAGYLLLCLGLGLRIWSLIYIGSHKSKELITQGPYSLCRNPLYLGSFVLYLGTVLCLENIVLLFLMAVVVVPLHLMVIISEEKHLLKIFGEAYGRYQNRTPRLLMRFRHFETPAMIQVSTKTVYRTMRETIGVLLIPPAGRLIELLQLEGILPVLVTLP